MHQIVEEGRNRQQGNADKIKKYVETNDMIHDLSDGKIDVILLDEPSANYWVIHSSGRFMKINNPINVGFGLGIAVNKNDKQLLSDINKAIHDIQESGEFKRLYTKYFEL